jgi:hypothetical protein
MSTSEKPGSWPVIWRIKGRTFVAGNLEDVKQIKDALQQGGDVAGELAKAGLGLVEQKKKK